MARQPAVVLVVLASLFASTAAAQGRGITGTVTDSATGEVLSGVRVVSLQASRTTFTDEHGRFRLSGVSGGDFSFARIGYRPQRLSWPGGDSVTVPLVAVRLPLEAVVVSASRTEQAALDAPAAITSMDRAAVAAEPALTVADHLARAPGFDMAEKGVIQRTYSVRGDRGTNSLSLLTLTDYRNSSVPSLAFNVPYIVPATDEDIERIELTRGPGAALYGPGADRGVLHIITRSPFESRGLTLALTGGTRELGGGTIRWAALLGPRVAFKLSADYLRARDWFYHDPNDDSTVHRDPIAERAGGEARLDWRPDSATEVVTTVGVAQAFRVVELAGDAGPAQVKDWRYTTFQALARRGRLLANAYLNLSNTGATYLLRSATGVVDSSRMAAAQLQDGAHAGPLDLLFGADWRWTNPRTGGTVDGVNEDHDNVTETGAYIHGTANLGPRLEAIGALRIDHHSVLADNVFSPRAGLVYHPSAHHALRLTFNRAFSSPEANSLFLDIGEGTFPQTAFDVRVGSVPRSGLTFDRTCGGPCMHSPYAANPSQALAPDPTLLWDSVVAWVWEKDSIDISGIPRPSSSDIGPAYWAYDPNSHSLVPATTVADVQPLRRTLSNTIELGWKAEWKLGGELAVDLYTSRVIDPQGPSYTATPWVMLDSAQMATYLAGFVGPAGGEQLAAGLQYVPLGIVTPHLSPHPNELLILPRQGGSYRIYGADISATVPLNATWRVSGYVSLVNQDSIANVGPGGTPVVLGVPKTKGSVSIGWSDTARSLEAELTVRAVESFPIASGAIYVGRVRSYTLADARFAMPLGPRATFLVEARNLLDDRHQEFVYTAPIGRMIVTRLRMSL